MLYHAKATKADITALAESGSCAGWAEDDANNNSTEHIIVVIIMSK